MRLAEATQADLAGEVARVLDARLRRADPRPVAVALSGGGDSVALLLAAHLWAGEARRPLLVLTVDHGLQAEGHRWTAACRRRAEAFGLPFRALAWTGAKPARGLPAAARRARHALLAEAAREAGARVILMGHTADDVVEARAMRAAGSSTPAPRIWSPSPAWPEGRGVFLARPLLGLRRAEVRAWLVARRESWIEDPANADPRYARARARAAMGAAAELAAPAPERPRLVRLALAAEAGPAGDLAISRDALRAAAFDTAAAFLSAACLCAGGGARPAIPARVRRLAERARGDEAFTAALAGARIEAEAGRLLIAREAGERARGGLARLRLSAGEVAVWDGRFEVRAQDAASVRPLAGLAARLPKAERAALTAIPAAARGALPVVEGEPPHCPLLAPDGASVAARVLVQARLLAACGAAAAEPAD